MTGPARITIELEPPDASHDGWEARTWIDQPQSLALDEPFAAETREPAVVPAAYEPPEDCTCLEGFCDTDHANE